jgi:hypothetical protein
MANLTESYIRKIVREIIKESLILEISAEEKTKAYAKSNERVPFNADLMKQAIMQGREVGLNFKSNNDKYTMPTTKTRIIHPVAYGVNKSGRGVVRGLHITGQSEKEAIRTGSRSAEIEAETEGMGAWRMFKTENIKSMWFTDRFFSDDIPGYNPNDKGMASIYVSYNPSTAKKYQDELVAARRTSTKPIETQPQAEPKVEPQVQPQKTNPVDKDIEQMGYENKPIQEKKKNVRNFFK